ncbi:MAG: ribonuclease HII [Clostridia bacterium]|nr:ribonuclease HII [Clostridia bacterium]
MEYRYEDAARSRGFSLICGIDEAGRGPLAGPVYAAAVILPPGCDLPGLNDSKKLSEKKREALFPLIKEEAVAWAVASASVEEIDSLNILNATFLAMRRAQEALPTAADYALIDGNRLPPLSISAETIIGGDGISPSIAAASILAKVSRDHYMETLDRMYPEYQFLKHKGYGTALHRELILRYGPSPVHRRTFLGKILNGKK